MKRLKILLLTREYPPDTNWGGIATRLSIKAKALAEKGHEVHVLSCVDNQAVQDYVENGVFVHRRNQIHIKGAKRIIAGWLKLPETLQRLKTGLSNILETNRLKLGQIDIVEYPDYGAEGWCFALSKKYNCVCRMASPVFVDINLSKSGYSDSSLDLRFAAKLEHFGMRKAKIIISPANYLVNKLKLSGWLHDENPVLIPNSIDWREWTKVKPVKETKPVILFVGRLEWNKAPETIVYALQIIRRKIPDAKAIFIGRTGRTKKGENYMEWMKRELPSLDGCEFPGELSREEIKDYMSLARAFTLPSWTENYSNAVLEAMASARPVVIGENSGIAELIENSDAGKAIPSGNPEELARTLMPYLEDASYAHAAGMVARKKVMTENDPDIISSKIEDLYLSVLNGSATNRMKVLN